MTPGIGERRLVRVIGVVLLIAVAACDRWVTSPARYHSVNVAVTTPRGAPVKGVRFLLYTGVRPMGWGESDAKGLYEFTDVPDGEYGVYADVLPVGYHAQEELAGGTRSTLKDGLTVSATSSPKVSFVLVREGPGTVVVRVVKPDGSAFVAVPVNLDDQFGHSRGGLTDATGTYVFAQVPYGLYFANVANPDRFESAGAPAFIYSRAIPVDSGARDSVALQISPCSGNVSVRVVGGNGSGVAAFPVRLYTSTVILQEVTTDATGTVQFSGLQCGEYGVSLRPKAGYTYVDSLGLSFSSVVVKRGTSNPFTFRVTP